MGCVVALTRSDKTAAAFAAAFVGLIAVESVLLGQDGLDADIAAAAEAIDLGVEAGASPLHDARGVTHPDLVAVEHVAHIDGARETRFIATGACRGYAAWASARLQRLAAGKSDATLPQTRHEKGGLLRNSR